MIDRIPQQLWVPAWIPQLRILSRKHETGRQQKIGGAPGLLPGESWPFLNGKPAMFVMQFHDPRPGQRKRFVQLFLPQELEGSGEQALIRVIPDVNQLKLATRVPIENGLYSDALESNQGTIRLITGWQRMDETSHFHIQAYFLEHAAIPLDETWDRLERGEFGRVPTPYEQEKIGGIGNACQDSDFTMFIQNLFPLEWGDAGSIHVSDDGLVAGDMC
jgi:hypothetical protein